MFAITFNISFNALKQAVVPICSRVANTQQSYSLGLRQFSSRYLCFPFFVFMCLCDFQFIYRFSCSVHVYYVPATFHTLFQVLGETEKQILALMFRHSCKPQSFITAARKNHSYPPSPELACNQQWRNFTAWSLKVIFQEDCSILLYCHLICPVSSILLR